MPFPLDPQWLDAAEGELGSRLPASYRSRLSRDNGGEIELNDEPWILHPVLDKTDRQRLARSCHHILVETSSAREWDGFPENAIAIASNGSGDLLLLMRDEDSGASFDSMVWLWNHETRQLEALGDFADAVG